MDDLELQKKLRDKAQSAYWSMQARCRNPNVKNFKEYGGRGITCAFQSSAEFIEAIGLPPTLKHTVDRIDNSKGYEKGNVRWADMRQQSNNRRSNTVLEIDGEKKTIAEWARVSGIPDRVISLRFTRRKWPPKESVFLPLGTRFGPNVRKGAKYKKKNPLRQT